VGLQALIETAAGLSRVGEIAGASDRLETLITGYADLAASLGRPPGAGYPGDRWHWVRSSVQVAARAAGLQAIDGPHLDIANLEGLRTEAGWARALGFDGKWALHPSQIDPLNEVFSPTQEEVGRATAVLDALAATDGSGAALLDGEMIDEASRKLAAQVVARGRAAGLL
jgi:citrate lyase subunit beta/citryl-CoA lyase